MSAIASKKGQVTSKKPPYRGFTFKERLLPSILLALLAPLTVCFVAPFEIYGSNFAEFKFLLSDFWALCLLIAVGAALLLGTALLLSRGKLFNILYGLIFGLSLMFFLQGNYLSLGQNSLTGDGTAEAISVGYMVFDTVLWVLVTAACITAMLLLNRHEKHKDTVRLVATMATAVLLFMSFVSFLTTSLTTDVYATEKSGGTDGQQVLTNENLNTLAKDDNIIVFIVDRFDADYYDEAMKDCPEIFDELDGFTYFTDYISRYPRTFPGITYLATGRETDFSMSREEYLKDAYQNSDLLHAIKNSGYDINLYTQSYYGYENAADMADCVTNVSPQIGYEIVDRPRLSLDMLRLSLYRYLPSCFRFVVGDIRTTTFDRYVEYDATEGDVYTPDMKDIYADVSGEDFTFRDADKGYSFIHMDGTHLPNKYDENFNDVSAEDKYDANVAMKQSFKIIAAYIQEMKRMGVYEDATIVITGDHASIGYDKREVQFPHMTALLVKPAGATQEEILTSNAQISPEDVMATVLKAAGSPLASDFGRTVFEIPEDEERTRRYYFQLMDGQNHEQIVYDIVGAGRDFENWHIVDRYFLNKTIYQ